MPQKKIKIKFSFSIKGSEKLIKRPNINPVNKHKKLLNDHFLTFGIINNNDDRIMPKKVAHTFLSK